ncbi:MAG TPA: TCP-1/cpn60 chaperonin family protein [Syntrophomonadaceae bacterium]|nr:TCP-1/cpn60 chaperonin family protein [Syntrophomonadaceae bacterium]
MTEGSLSGKHNIDERFQALLNNSSAARAVSQLVEGTIGPKGLDTMLVDSFGDVAISNDGATILEMVEIRHPAARMIVNAARAQKDEVGDGTTTATILAGALVAEGVDQVLRGVPVTRIIEGIQTGIQAAQQLLVRAARPITSVYDQRLEDIARVAGRGHSDLAALVLEGARLVGEPLLLDRDYRFAEAVVAHEHADHRVFKGLVLNKEPVNREMPRWVENATILVVDDALEPEELAREAMKSEAGFTYYLQAREQYERNLQKICQLGVKVVVVDRALDDIAEQIFSENGVLALHRVSSREIERLCRHTGARKIKRSSLNRDVEVIRDNLGFAQRVEVEEKFHHTCIYAGQGQPWATLLVGAATEEVVDEVERMARDAAASVQAALREGVVPGGGAIEVWMAVSLEELARGLEGMHSYGVLAVKEALLKPFTCMAANAGFNPLEKLGDVTAAQKRQASDQISFDSDTGNLIDVMEKGIIDPVKVKMHALQAAGEVATAILRINTVIQMKDEELKPSRQDILE